MEKPKNKLAPDLRWPVLTRKSLAGFTRKLTSGAISERYAYTAYGTPTITDASGTTRTTTAIGNRYMYTGREWDEALALYHYRARMYDPVAGRFVSRDPIGYVDGANAYRSYFAPSSTDPFGLFWGVGGGAPGEVCGLAVALYAGSWCVSVKTWNDISDMLLGGFKKQLECQIEETVITTAIITGAGATACVPCWPKSEELLKKGFGPTINKRQWISPLSRLELFLRGKKITSRGGMMRGVSNQLKRSLMKLGSKCLVGVLIVETVITWDCAQKSFPQADSPECPPGDFWHPKFGCIPHTGGSVK